MGYNAEVANSLASLSVNYSPEDKRVFGMSVAVIDTFAHLMGSGEYYGFQPCVQATINPQEARSILLEFIRDNPEQQRDTTAIMILAKALYYQVCPGPKQHLQPHMEQCTTWDYDNDQFGTENTCDEAVVIQFLTKDQPMIERQLNPGEAFRTGSQIDRGFWMSTTCPVDYVSSIPFLPENRLEIGASRYSCTRK